MKTTKTLLEKHGMGLCTEEEKKAIERWFETLDDPSLSLTIDDEDDYDDESIWSKMSQDLPELENQMSERTAKKIVFFQNSFKYAAAACFALVVFFGGRFSVGTATASPALKDPTANHLFIYGGNGAKGNLPGDDFKVQFNGTIKLYNNGLSNKTIIVGDSSFVLESHRYYYLLGDLENPKLRSNHGSEQPLEGDFILSRIRD
ncbi:MAG: hypothetical protein AAF600_10020 [Bacteroidota bacterium]